MSRRNMELFLLCLAAPIVIVLFAMLVLVGGQELSFNTLGVPIGIFVAFLLAHLAVRKLTPNADPAILPITFALSGIGIAFVTRLAPASASRQLMWLFAGVAVLIFILWFVKSLDKLAEYKYTFIIVGILLLLSPMLPIIGTEINGSRLWLSIGGFSFQPGELAKICIVIFLAGYMAQNREMLSIFTWKVGPVRLPSLATLLPLIVMWALAFIVVVLEKDLGSALVLFLVFLVVLYVATGKKFYILIGVILAALASVILFHFFSHVQTRVSIWLDPFKDAQGSGYQLVQSIYSLADGGIFGVGIGKGLCTSIPYVESDFIFAAICEETGLLGGAGVLLLYLTFAIRGVCISARAKSDVSCFMASGCTAIIILQAFIIVGGVTRLIPMTGITLPFISQGGTSLICGFIIVAFMLKAGEEGTGIGTEMQTMAHRRHSMDEGVLGRFALGKRLTVQIIIYSLMFAALVANLTYAMVINADNVKSMSSNNHTIAKEATTERGSISTSDGVVLARSEKQDDGSYSRVYPAGDLATHVLGYYSTRFGTSGIEASWNDTLTGESNLATFDDLLKYMMGTKTAGNDVKLTINSSVQQAAQDALSGYKGSCVVMDPTTGEVLAMASSPTYDASDAESVLAASASDSSDSSLLNRATLSLSSPGSTFKTVTLTSAFENGVASEDTVYSAPGSIDIGNAAVTNYGGYGYGDLSLKRGYEYSLNTVFGQLGTQIGAQRLVTSAEKFGFNDNISFDLPVLTSLMPDASEMTEWETAWAAAGEPVGQHTSPAGPQTNTFQMALVACAVANNGTIMQPYLVKSTNNANGEISYTAKSSVYKTAMSSTTASRVLECMKGVVSEGTGAAASVSGVTVAGKTGTAENQGREADSWFIGIGDADGAKNVVVAIELEEAGEGTATSRVQSVISAALKAQGVIG